MNEYTAIKDIIEIIDDWDTQLSEVSTLHDLASRIATGIDVDYDDNTLTNAKLEELWTLLDWLKAKINGVRKEMQPVIKIDLPKCDEA